MTVTTIHFNSLYEHLSPLIDSVVASGLPVDSRMVYDGPRNTVVAVTAEDGTDVSIKAFRVPIWINRIAYGMLRPSKASRSFNNAMRLISLGFDTPEPIAYAEQRTLGLFGRSYYFCRHIHGVSEVRNIERLPECEDIMAEIAVLMVRLHRAGVLVKDFSPGNVLYRTDAEGRRRYMLVDINRMAFDVHDHERLMSMFTRMMNTEKLTARLAYHYCRAAGIAPDSPDGQALIAEAIAVYRLFWGRRRQY